MRNYKEDVYDIKDTSWITTIPLLKEFENLEDLNNFVEVMNKNGIGVVIKTEYSNFYQGVLVEVFDKKTVNEKAKKGLLK